MTICPNCGKEVVKPSRVLKNHCFTINAYECTECHHNFKITTNESDYVQLNVDLYSKLMLR